MNYIIDMCGGLEWIADCKVKCGVTVPVGMDDWPLFLSHRRIVGFHADIKADKEIREIHSQAKAVGGRQFFIERIEMEHATRLIGIIMDGPYITNVDEGSQFKNPE